MGWILGRRLSVLSYNGIRFPHQQPREDPTRAERQRLLWERYNDKAAEIAEGPPELDALTQWVKGKTPNVIPGVLAQHVAGSFFSDDYWATPQSWTAAVMVSTASVSGNIPQLLWWFLSGKIRKAKKLLGSMAKK